MIDPKYVRMGLVVAAGIAGLLAMTLFPAGPWHDILIALAALKIGVVVPSP